jgi:Ankyrin repeats (many copies)
MFPSPQSALPLPARPSLERYRKLAKELLNICKAAQLEASQPEILRAWAEGWIDTLIRLSGVVIAQPVDTREWLDGLEAFARRILLSAEDSCTLAHAQFVLARSHGFASWAKFAAYLRAHEQVHSMQANFEAAVDAIIRGDASTLRRLLREQPELVHARSMREHEATLLHYTAANGVENYRQKTPPNIVEITEVLLQSGAEVDATAHAYGAEATTLDLAATSGHPEHVGVIEALLSKLLEHGAALEPTAGQSIVMACLANGRIQAAAFLAGRGARCGFVEAAALGRLDTVRDHFSRGSFSPNNPSPAQPEINRAEIDHAEINQALLYACVYGQAEVASLLIAHGADLTAQTRDGQTTLHQAVIGCDVAMVRLLLAHNPPLEATNSYGGTPAGQALWSAAHSADPDRYIPILETLFEAGASLPERHAAISPRVDAWLAERGSRVESEWRW